MNILVPNLGSTSLKYQILDMPSEAVLARGRFERVSDYRDAIRRIPIRETPVDTVAFKTVHGGWNYRGTYRIDGGVLSALERFRAAAPAHNTIYLAGIRAFREVLPEACFVAAFETEFHRTMPEFAARYGVPAGWREDNQVRRYGFHGASHQYASEQAGRIAGRPLNRLVSCHLGGSSSVCAIRNGRSIDTTMGFSPQSGLDNATRHGDVDVFAVLAMMDWHGWRAAEVSERLTRNAGLAGLSGVAGGDLRDIEAAAARGDASAALALEGFHYQVRKAIGAYAAALEGLDGIVFTGGIGENSARLREAVCAGLGFLGVVLDSQANDHGAGDRLVSSVDSRVALVALASNEELIVARRAYRILIQ